MSKLTRYTLDTNFKYIKDDEGESKPRPYTREDFMQGTAFVYRNVIYSIYIGERKYIHIGDSVVEHCSVIEIRAKSVLFEAEGIMLSVQTIEIPFTEMQHVD